MGKSNIVFYPVGNGDTTMIQLKNNQNILIDCYITEQSEDDKDISRYDLKTDIQERLLVRNKQRYIDVFVLTHPHKDHISGFESVFYTGEPDKYKNESELALIDEIWFAPRILLEDKKEMDEQAIVFRDEIERRIKLHKSNDLQKNNQGNRIKLVGYTDQKDISELKSILVTPGEIIDEINSLSNDFLEILVLGPTKLETDDEEDTNDTSVMLQFNFLENGETSTTAIFGGDAGSDNWQRVLKTNSTLTFDVLLAPHHGSFKFFNENRKDSDPYTPEKEIVDFIENAQKGCLIICSSKEIIKDQSPPSQPAVKVYKKHIENNDGEFICLGEYPEVKEPKPFILEISPQGPVINDDHIEVKKAQSSKVKVGNATKHTRTYGIAYEI